MNFPIPPIKEAAMNNTRTTLGRLGRAALALVAAAGLSWAAGAAIGMAVADGHFEVDGASVRGSSTIFEGSTVSTGGAISQLQIGNGVRMRLGARTKAQIYGNKLVLQSGDSQLEGGTGYEVEAQTLRIAPAAPGTVARIRLGSGRRVTVAALRGGVQVANAAGVVVANIDSGRSLDFEPQEAGAAAATRAAGCLIEKQGRYLLAEQVTNVILEVQGENLAGELGNRIEIMGIAESRTPAPPASGSIRVAGVKRISRGGCATLARKLGASAGVAAAGAGTTGASTVGTAASTGSTATVVVIGGVAAAATVGGLAAVGGLPGQGEHPASASR